MGVPQNIIPCLKLTHFRALVDPPHACYKLELVLGVQHLKGHHTMGTHVSIIPRGYDPYLRPKNLHFVMLLLHCSLPTLNFQY